MLVYETHCTLYTRDNIINDLSERPRKKLCYYVAFYVY